MNDTIARRRSLGLIVVATVLFVLVLGLSTVASGHQPTWPMPTAPVAG